MKIGIVTESFLPQINGVTNSVLRILEHFRDRGHEAIVVAPGDGSVEYAGARVVRVPAVPLPVYRSFPIALPTRQVEHALRAEIVSRRPNGTLTWLTGSPVERLTVLRRVPDRRVAA